MEVGRVLRGVLVLVGLFVPLLVRIAFYTVLERKVIASIQRRVGPNVIGIGGLLQAIADGLKLMVKEVIIPRDSYVVVYFLAPALIFVLRVRVWAVRPVSVFSWLVDLQYGVLFWLLLSSLGVYGIIFRGWASGSRYPFLGGVRAAAQIISYELVLITVVLTVAYVTITFNFIEIINFQSMSGCLIVPLFPAFMIRLIVGLAETNRTPFDRPEREAELVAGYNLEYSSLWFAFFFLREYANRLSRSVVVTALFMGGWDYFIIKVLLFAIFFIIVRAALPRFRYDQLRILSWHVLLPIAFGYFSFVVLVLLV